MKTYNKLVRDNIPEIIQKDNKTCQTRILNDEEYIQELIKKLHEEVCEVQNASNKQFLIEEIADVYEVMDAIKNVFQIDENEILNAQKQKAKKNGKFEKKIFLETVSDEK